MSAAGHHVPEAGRGLRSGHPDSCLMVICGASGDLTRRSLLPSVYELALKGLLPDRFAVLGFARSEWDDAEFRDRMQRAVEHECDFDADVWGRLADRIHYLQGDFDSDDAVQALSDRIGGLRTEHDLPDNVFFHLATPPSLFGTIATRLAAAGMAGGDGWRRLVIEKPFGEDRESARRLHAELGEAFNEDQIYRIDHFLGKETVQNMLVFRFANPSFEPVWNNRFVDHVEITVAEDIGIGTRASFYEQTGVVRDMVQNHLLQLLCMTAIEPPVRYDAQSLRDETVKVLRAIRSPAADATVFGQYRPGVVEGEKVAGYRDEDGVAAGSTTATFAALELEIDNWRWAGVPFYLRTGKRLARKLTEVVVQFKPTRHRMFDLEVDGQRHASSLVFRVQPEEGILQTFAAKQPGPEISVTPVTSRFLYADAFGVESPPRAYAWLILDVMEGEQTLFAREDWVDQAWAIVDPVVARSTAPDAVPDGYEAGSWGPPAAAELLARRDRSWRTP